MLSLFFYWFSDEIQSVELTTRGNGMDDTDGRQIKPAAAERGSETGAILSGEVVQVGRVDGAEIADLHGLACMAKHL